MAVTLNPQGKADWTDYQDYWRDDDAEWLQERSILRYATSAARTTDWAAPSPGHVTYNQATDQLEHFAATAPAKWIGVLASQHLAITPKTSAADADPVVLGHKGAGGGGFQFFPTVSSENKIAMPNAYLDVGGGKIILKPTGLTLNTGTKVAKLTTDADGFLSDSKFEAPSAVISGALTVNGASTLAAVTASGTFSGATINGTSGTIGGVWMGTSVVSAPSGYVAGQGYFYGSGATAVMRQRDTDGTLGGIYVQVTTAEVNVVGGYLTVQNQMRVYNNNSILFYGGAPGTLLGYGGPVVYSASDPGAANYPNGTIWFS